jgi:hypothetical protein
LHLSRVTARQDATRQATARSATMRDHCENARLSAETLVLRAIGGQVGHSRATAQEVPTLDLVGAAIARAARLAAADHRARLPRLRLANTQAAGLLKATRRERDALLGDLTAANEPTDGRLLQPTDCPKGFVWRLHPAPAVAGAAVALEGGARA